MESTLVLVQDSPDPGMGGGKTGEVSWDGTTLIWMHRTGQPQSRWEGGKGGRRVEMEWPQSRRISGEGRERAHT